MAASHIGVVKVAGGGHGKSAVPNHKVAVVVVAHFGLGNVLRLAVNCLFSCQIAINIVLNALVGLFGGEVVVKFGLNVRVFRRCGGIGGRHIMVAAVGTRHVGNVPNGVGACGVEQRTARQGVGEPFGVFLARQARILAGPIGAVPNGVVQSFLVTQRATTCMFGFRKPPASTKKNIPSMASILSIFQFPEGL